MCRLSQWSGNRNEFWFVSFSLLPSNPSTFPVILDHKPEDPPERSRIEKAGYKVTSDGRVSGMNYHL